MSSRNIFSNRICNLELHRCRRPAPPSKTAKFPKSPGAIAGPSNSFMKRAARHAMEHYVIEFRNADVKVGFEVSQKKPERSLHSQCGSLHPYNDDALNRASKQAVARMSAPTCRAIVWIFRGLVGPLDRRYALLRGAREKG